jgi:hypothetical protein
MGFGHFRQRTFITYQYAAIAAHPDMRYQTLSQQEGNLLWLFLLLTQAGSNSTAQWANLGTYLQNVRWQYAGAP